MTKFQQVWSGDLGKAFLSEVVRSFQRTLYFQVTRWCSKFPITSIFFFFLIVVGFVIHWNESAMDLHVFPISIPPPTSLSTRSLVFPVHQVWALVSCIPPGLVICFTIDNIHVSMLFSWNIPPSPSPTESKSLFYTSVSLLALVVKNPSANAGDAGSIPRLGWSPGEEHGNLFQYSCLENPKDRGTW